MIPKTITYYQTADTALFDQIDADRAKSEVALVDTKTGEAVYGVDAFIKILARNKPFLTRLSTDTRPFFLTKLYRFISYNRHVITGSHPQTIGRSCVPNIHRGYRWLYLILAAFFTGFMVNQFTLLLYHQLALTPVFWQEYAFALDKLLGSLVG